MTSAKELVFPIISVGFPRIVTDLTTSTLIIFEGSITTTKELFLKTKNEPKSDGFAFGLFICNFTGYVLSNVAKFERT